MASFKNQIANKMAHPKCRKLEGKETMISKFKENYFQHNILYQRNYQAREQKHREKEGIQETKLQYKGEDPLLTVMESQTMQERRASGKIQVRKLSRIDKITQCIYRTGKSTQKHFTVV